MTLWLMRQHLRQWDSWFVTALGAICILQWPYAGLSTVPIVLLLQLRTIPGRATLFDAALPISARDIVAARLFAKLLLISIPTIALGVAWQGELGEMFRFSRFLEAMGILALVHLLPYGIRPAVLNVSAPQAYIWPFGQLAVASGLILWLAPPVVGAAMLGGAVVALVAWTVATVPTSFERVASYGGVVGGAPTWPTRAPSEQIKAWRPVLPSMTPVPVIISFAVMLIGGWIGSWPWYLAMFPAVAHTVLRQRTAWLAALPLSHRARLFAVAVPFCFSSLGGLAVGRTLPKLFGQDRRMSADAPNSRYEQGSYYSSPTSVPLTYWRRMQTRPLPPGATHIGQHVEIVAPWGELVVADTFSILGMTYFDPFTTTAESSPRFVEWQFASATKAVYGRSISRRVYEDKSIPRPPRAVDAWSVQLLGGGLTLAALLYMLLVLELPLSARASRWQSPLASSLSLLLLYLPMYTIGGVCFYFSKDRGASIFIPMIERMLLAITRSLPDNLMVVAVVAAIPPALLYTLLDRQFTRSEVSRAPTPRA
ncbi:hypothetical protein [Gemmatimonas sp.]|uniref:hypothetical protein n=1 Tax=Gemmatimonas sp. TaxID=1962908 RepID=UPI00286BE7F5|nr:hypothetical protein [Gemmatimonas sp.]